MKKVLLFYTFMLGSMYDFSGCMSDILEHKRNDEIILRKSLYPIESFKRVTQFRDIVTLAIMGEVNTKALRSDLLKVAVWYREQSNQMMFFDFPSQDELTRQLSQRIMSRYAEDCADIVSEAISIIDLSSEIGNHEND